MGRYGHAWGDFAPVRKFDGKKYYLLEGKVFRRKRDAEAEKKKLKEEGYLVRTVSKFEPGMGRVYVLYYRKPGRR